MDIKDILKIKTEQGENNLPAQPVYDFTHIDDEFFGKTKDVSLNSDIVEDYANKGVQISYGEDLAKYDKLLADKQGVGGELANATGQIANELILGSAQGMVSIVDGIYNAIANDGYNDYNSDAAIYLQELQDNINKHIEIYRENPNEVIDATDSAWYAENLVSLASAISMLIPARAATGVARGLGKVGNIGNKAAKIATSTAKGINKGIYKTGLTGISKGLSKVASPTNRQAFNTVVEMASDAYVMRHIEAYQTAEDVHADLYEPAIDRFNSMTDAEKTSLFSAYPELTSDNAEDFASKLSSNAANKAYKDNIYLMAFDFLQLRGLRNLYKGVGGGVKSALASPKASIQRAYQNAAKELTGDAKDTFLLRRIDNIKELAPQAFSEGLEEAIVYVGGESAKDTGRKILDSDYKIRNSQSYMNDPNLWNSAIWGAIGGIGFQIGGDAISSLSDYAGNKWDNRNRKEGDSEIKRRVNYEKQQKEAIKNQTARTRMLLTDIDVLEKGENPFIKKGNGEDVGNISRDLYQELDPIKDKDILKQALVDEFLAESAYQAVESGTDGLLLEYLNDVNFEKFVEDKSDSDGVIMNHIRQGVSDMSKDYTNIYNDTYNRLYNQFDDVDENITSIISRNIIRNKYKAKGLKTKFNNQSSLINDYIDRTYHSEDIPGIKLSISKLEAENKIAYLLERNSMLDKASNELPADATKENKAYYIKNAEKQIRKAKSKIAKDLFNIPEVRSSYIAHMSLKGVDGDKINKNIAKSKDLDVLINDILPNITFNNNDVITMLDQDIVDMVAEKQYLENQIIEYDDISYVDDVDLKDNYSQLSYAINKIANSAIDSSLNRLYNIISSDGVKNSYTTNTEMFNDIIKGFVKNGDSTINVSEEVDVLNISDSSGLAWIGELEKRIINNSIVEAALELENEQESENNKEIANDSENNPTETEEDINREEEQLVEDLKEDIVDQTDYNKNNIDNQILDSEPIDSSTGEINDQDIQKEIPSIPYENLLDLQKQSILVFQRAYNAEPERIEELFNSYLDGKDPKDVIKAIFDKYVEFYNKQPDINLLTARNMAVFEMQRSVNPLMKHYIAKNKSSNMYSNIGAFRTLTSGEFDIITKTLDNYATINDLPVKKINGVESTIINVNDLIDSIIYDETLDYHQVLTIYMNLSDYIDAYKKQNTDSNFIFTNRSNLVKYSKVGKNAKHRLELISRQIQQIINVRANTVSENYHIQPVSDLSPTDLNKGDDLTIEVTDQNAILFKNKNNKTVAVAAKITKSSSDTNYSDLKANGLSYSISKVGNFYTSNFDRIFKQAFNKEENTSIGIDENGNELPSLFEIRVSANQNEGLLYNGYSNAYISQKIKDSLTKYELSSIRINGKNGKDIPAIELVQFLFNELNKLESPIDRNMQRWYSQVYDNYENTYYIQENQSDETNFVRVKSLDKSIQLLTGFDKDGKRIYNNLNSIGLTSDNEYGYIDLDGTIVTESGKRYDQMLLSNNEIPLAFGSTGLLLVSENGTARLASIETDGNKLDKNSELYNGLYNELFNTIKTRLTSDMNMIDIEFGQIIKKFNYLFQIDAKEKEGNVNDVSLFKGVVISFVNGNLKLQKRIVNSNTKQFEYTELLTIWANNNGKRPGIQVGSELITSDDQIDKVVNSILNNIQFANPRRFATSAEIGNSYSVIQKTPIATTIRLGGQEFIYKNYSDYALQNNAYKTTQDVNSNGDHMIADFSTLFVDIKSRSTPVEGNIAQAKGRNTTDRLNNLFPETDDKSTKDLLNDIMDNSLVYNKEEHSEIINEAIEKGLIPEKVNVRRNTDENVNVEGQYNASTDKITVFDNYLKSSEKNKDTFYRVLLHEQFHRRYKEANDAGEIGKQTVDDLIDTFNKTLEFVENEVNSGNESYRVLLDYLNDKFNTGSFLVGDKLVDIHESDYSKRVFAEEWFVESFSNKFLMDWLGGIEYTGDIDTSNKDTKESILQKIISLVIKFFNKSFGNYKKNSILETEYLLLGNKLSEVIAETTEVKSNKIPSILRRRYSTTTSLNSTNTKYDLTNSIIGSVNEFDTKQSLDLASFIENGGINYMC